jgi:hypothetical protein
VIFSTYSICRINERIIDSYDVDVIVLDGISEDNTSDTTEAINADLYWCHDSKELSIGYAIVPQFSKIRKLCALSCSECELTQL